MTELITTFDTARLIKKRDKFVSDLKFQAMCLDELLKENNEFVDWDLGTRMKQVVTPQYLGEFEKKMDAQAWGYLLEKSGFKTFMDTKSKNDWDDKIKLYQTPSLTVENIERVLKEIYDSRQEMFEREVESFYRSMSWDLTKKEPILLGKKIIKNPGNCGRNNLYKPNITMIDRMVNAFAKMDGKPEINHTENFSYWVHCAPNDKLQHGAWTDYISVKLFNNNNAHITLLRSDLVEMMNDLIRRRFR